MLILRFLIHLIPFFLAIGAASAAVVTYTNKMQWQDAVGDFTTVDFTGYPSFTIVNNQYASQGILFTNNTDFIYHPGYFPDGAGLQTQSIEPIGTIRLTYLSDQQWISVDFVADLQFRLFNNGQLFYTSPIFGDGNSPFAGLISTTPFDRVEIFNPGSSVVAIDNLYFGPPIPAPAVLAFMTIGTALGINRRRRGV